MNKKHKNIDPQFKALANHADDVRLLLPEQILSRWHPDIHAADDSDAATINIYDIIGEDFWTGEGMTGKIVSSILRKNKGKAITVNINSPGGSFFEGLAIYNLLKEHDADVTVNVVGMAASAASVIAMAGKTIKVAEAGFLMIHNAWNCVCGNKSEMRDMADTLESFDDSMILLYAKKTGMAEKDIATMMDAETWISGTDAVEMGFATSTLDSDNIAESDDEQAKYSTSLKEVDIALAKAGHTRSQRRGLLKDLTSTPGATVKEETTPRAGNEKLFDAMVALNKTLSTTK